MAPDGEGFEDGEEFLVMNIVVEFGRVEGVRVEGDRMDFSVL